MWTIGQQLMVRKLYPKPEPLDPRDAVPESKPARGKPAGAAALTDGDSGGKAKREGAGAGAKGAVNGAGNGRTGKPPPSPRKKKKRSGRRR